MTGSTTVRPTRLVARTRALAHRIDPLDLAAPDCFVWLAPEHAFVASGVAARATLDEVERVLSSVDVDDDLGSPGTGPLACGALPFDLGPDAGLVVPERIVGRDAEGRSWVTDVGTPEQLAAAAPVPLVARGSARAPTGVTVRDGVARDAWDGVVIRALAAIDAGAVCKVVLARDVTVEADAPFVARTIAGRLREQQPGCYVFADAGIVGATPELLVARRGATAVSRPMAGTACGDEAAVAALVASAKDELEHRSVVQAVTTALDAHGVAPPTVRGPIPERFGALAHLATTVEVALDPLAAPSALELARDLHPTPAVGGVPADAARRLIAALEPAGRGRYAGPVGWVDAAGDGEWAIALRCAQLDGHGAVLHAGAGIVAGSDPAAEWHETQAKLAPMLTALGVRPPATRRA